MTVKGGTSRPLFATMLLNDFAVTWAGPNPLRPGFCFGSEDGRLLFTDEGGSQLAELSKASHSGEAINGVARSGEWLGVSTRADVTVGSVYPENKRGTVVLPYGAHGITDAPGGYLVAPLGFAGIMLMKPGPGPEHAIAALGSEQHSRYFYRVAAVQGADGKTLLLCACRQAGIGITEIEWGQEAYNMRVATFDGLDVVDVCAVNANAMSPSLAAVGRDGTLILVRDGLHDECPTAIKFSSLQGTVYRLLSSRGHVFVLTNRGLFGLMNLAERLVQGLPAGKFLTQVLTFPLEAVDANLVGDRWLLAVTPDGICKFDVVAIEQSTAEGRGNGAIDQAAPETLIRDWKVSGVAQKSRELVAAP